MDRFWNKVKILSVNECWEWVGGFCTAGYGVFKLKGKSKLAHRVSFVLTYGELQNDNLFVCHKCDNRKCVNPNHLFLGSVQDNNRDRENKGRGKSAKGSEQGLSKLTEIDIIVIRELSNSGQTHDKIAKIFGVSRVSVTNIINRNTWKHVK